MPKKFLRRVVSMPHIQLEHKYLRWLEPLLKDPDLLHINRHSVSVAFFVGLFIAFLPIPGQSLVAAVLALLLRCNLPVSVLLVWLTNPVTMTPILIFTYQLGSWILGSAPVDFHFHLSWEWFDEQGRRIILPLLLGSVITGLVSGAVGYLTIQLLWRWKVVSSWEARRKSRLHPSWQPKGRVAKDIPAAQDPD